MEISRVRVRCWNHDTGGVRSLPNIPPIGSASHFSNQDGSQSFGSEFLVDAEEIDLDHLNLLAINGYVDWNGRDKTKELVLLTTSHSKHHIRLRVGRRKSPSEEINGVIKPEECIVILHVVLCKQLVNIVGFFIIVNVHIRPVVTWWQFQGFGLNFIHRFMLVNWSVIILILHQLSSLWHRLVLPETMGVQ